MRDRAIVGHSSCQPVWSRIRSVSASPPQPNFPWPGQRAGHGTQVVRGCPARSAPKAGLSLAGVLDGVGNLLGGCGRVAVTRFLDEPLVDFGGHDLLRSKHSVRVQHRVGDMGQIHPGIDQ